MVACRGTVFEFSHRLHVFEREKFVYSEPFTINDFLFSSHTFGKGGEKKFFLCFTYVQIYSLLHFDVKLQNYFLKYYSCALNRTSECTACTFSPQALSTRDQLNSTGWIRVSKRESQ